MRYVHWSVSRNLTIERNVVKPLANSSEISKSLSFADMDRYSAVTDMRFDARTDLVSCMEDIVFCRETG